jgi:DNA replication and repair protein RecF
VFGILDPHRSAVVLALLQSDAVGQSLITAARREPFDEAVPFSEAEHHALEVRAGQVLASVDGASAA